MNITISQEMKKKIKETNHLLLHGLPPFSPIIHYPMAIISSYEKTIAPALTSAGTGMPGFL